MKTLNFIMGLILLIFGILFILMQVLIHITKEFGGWHDWLSLVTSLWVIVYGSYLVIENFPRRVPKEISPRYLKVIEKSGVKIGICAAITDPDNRHPFLYQKENFKQ